MLAYCQEQPQKHHIPQFTTNCYKNVTCRPHSSPPHFSPFFSEKLSGTEFRSSAQLLSDRFKRLRLRPSAPTPGEKILRKQWQKNSALCNRLNRASHTPVTSRSNNKTATVQNFNLRTSAELAWRQKNSRRQEMRDMAKRKENNSTATSGGNKGQVYSASKQVIMPIGNRNVIYPQNRPLIPCKFSKAVNQLGKAESNPRRVSPPRTPLNSPDRSIKNHMQSSGLKRSVESHGVKAHTDKEDDVTCAAKICDDEDKTNIRCTVKFNRKYNQNNISPVQPLVLAKPTYKSISRKNLDKNSFILIKSVHPKYNKDQNEKDCFKKSECIGQVKLNIFLSKEQPKSITTFKQTQALICEKKTAQSLESTPLKIKQLGNHAFDGGHKRISAEAAHMLQPFMHSKNQFGPKRFYHPTAISNNRIKERCYSCQTRKLLKLPEENRELIVPNPSLVDYSKESASLCQDDITSPMRMERGQDPIVTLRILSWLEDVKSEPDHCHDTDENPVNY